MNQMFDVFISYRRSDGTELAKAVRDYLTSRGLRVFLDTRELIDGQYFDTQLRERLIETPNYVLIATPEAFQFRKGEDWVREEMKLAVSEFKKNPQNRSVIPFVPNGTVFPESGLPEGLEDMPRFNRILLKDTKPTGAELLRLAKAICRVNRRNMWNAGQRVLERSKTEGSRFHLLHVDERIMPLYKKDKRAKAHGATLPINVTSGESKEESSLRDALQAQQGSLYLIGEGGIGKTTAMISIMERHYTDQSYSDSGEIPIFVELNGAPKSAKWYQGEDGLASDFIRREIARLFLGVNSIGKVPKDYVSGMDALFTKETDTPEYLLLLDGLNEVSTDYVSDENGRSQPIRSLIIEEINYLLTECPNVRVMLTSRTDETEINCSEHGIEKLYLTGLHKDSITEYLASKKFSSREIKDALADERLFDCIRIPLFLTMFAALNKTKGVSSRGEIFSRFFHERSDELQNEYTQKNRLDSLKKDTVNKGQLRFILDFLLPAIGCEMERRNDFKLTAEEAAKIILPLLEGKDANGNKPEKTAHPCAVIGEYGKQCFAGYKGSASLPKIASSLLSVSGDISEVAEYILTSAVDILGILYRDDNAEYGFIHHHFRDYFADVHDINLLRIAVQANTKKKPDLSFESLAPFIANANRREKSVFIGEILGEHHNKPTLKGYTWHYNVPTAPEDRNLLKRALELFRGRFGEEVGYGVFNLIEIWKIVREDLSGSDFSGLDLSLVTFNGVHLGHTASDGADFRGAKAGMKNLLCQGHSGSVTSVAFAPDGKTFLSGSYDNTVRVWDSATGQCLRVCEGHSDDVNAIAFAPDGKTFLSGSGDAVRVWDSATGQCLRICEGHRRGVRAVAFAPDGKTFLSGARDRTVRVWDSATGQCLRVCEGHSDD
ncbi:MAG: TIR domain-containing protein, partial [Clostridia bacterium]|nr:TIR domain-containing protein [Clostridia bacterium]